MIIIKNLIKYYEINDISTRKGHDQYTISLFYKYRILREVFRRKDERDNKRSKG